MTGGISLEFLIGSVAFVSIFTIWLFTFHKKFVISLVKTRKVNTFGVYTDFDEALQTHFWYLLKAKILPEYQGRSLVGVCFAFGSLGQNLKPITK